MSAAHTAERILTGVSHGEVQGEGQEPVSGVQGAGTASDPYDAGNAADAPGQTVENPVSRAQGTSAYTSTPTTGQGVPESAPSTNRPGKFDPPSHGEKMKGEDTGIDPSQREQQFPSAPDTAKTSEFAPSVGGEQGEVQGGVQPRAKPGDEAIPSSSYSGSKGEGGEEESKASKGTGEKYVKSTGFAAEGGNFDATEPGAGKEADRLREAKGETVGAAKDTSQQSEEHGHGHGKAHSPKFAKVKEKLHIGKHHS